MLYLDSPIGPIEGLTIWRDHQDQSLFYYISERPRLARNDGVAEFVFLKYKRDITDNPAFDPATKQALGGGFLAFTVDLGVDDDKLNTVKQKLGEFSQGGDVNLTPVQFRKGSVRLSITKDATAAPGAPPSQPAGLSFFEEVYGTSMPSLFGFNRATFSLVLSQEGATLFEAALKAGISPIGVIYDLEFLGLRPAFNVHVTAEDHRIYSDLEMQFGARGQIYAVSIAAEVDLAFQKLRESGAVKVEILNFTDDDSIRKQADAAFDWIKQDLAHDFFNVAMEPPSFMKPGGGTAGGGGTSIGLPGGGSVNVPGGGSVKLPGGGSVNLPGGSGSHPVTNPPAGGPTSPGQTATGGGKQVTGPNPPTTQPGGPGATTPPVNLPATQTGAGAAAASVPPPAGPAAPPANVTPPAGPAAPVVSGPPAPVTPPHPVTGPGAAPPPPAKTGGATPPPSGGAGGGGAGNKPPGGTNPLSPFAIGFTLKSINQDSLKTREFTLSEQAAVARQVAPQGLFTTMTDGLDLPIKEVSLDDDFFTRLIGTISLTSDMAVSGIDDVTVNVQYPGTAVGTEEEKPIGGKLFTPTDLTALTFNSWLNDRKELSYRYKMDINFRADSPWAGKGPHVGSEWTVSQARQLALDPLDHIALFDIEIASGALDATLISQVQVEIIYDDPTNTFHLEKTFLLKPGDPSQHWKLRLSDPDHKSYQYRVTYFFQENLQFKSDWITTENPALVVNSPFKGLLTVRLVPLLNPDELLEADVTVSYRDAKTGYSHQLQKVFTPTDLKSQALTIPTLAPNPTDYSYEVTVVRADGSVFGPTTLAGTSPVAVISDGAGTTHRIKVMLLGTDLAAAGLVALKVDATGPGNQPDSDTVLFTPSQSEAKLLSLVQAGATSTFTYSYAVTGYNHQGLPVAGERGQSAATELLVHVPTAGDA